MSSLTATSRLMAVDATAELHAAASSRAEVLEQVGGGARRRRRKLVIKLLIWGVALLSIVGAIAALWWWRASSGRVELDYATQAASRGDIHERIAATGTLAPNVEVIVGAEVSGKIAEVFVDEDERVAAGQLLARFDLEAFERELAEAQASLAAARADVRRAAAGHANAIAEAERSAELFEQGIASSSEQDAREAARAQAQAELARAHAQRRLAQARVEQIQTRIAKAEVRSPISGVVLRRMIEPGSTVQAAFQSPELFTIAADLHAMQLELEIDEADVARVAPGQTARFVVDAWPKREFGARVVKVALAPTITGNVVSYVATLAVDNDALELRPGMTATATIDTGVREQVLRVPTLALRFSPPEPAQTKFRLGPPPATRTHAIGSAVWVLRAGEPVRVAVTTGSAEGEWTEVVDGELEPGDPVIVGITREGEA